MAFRIIQETADLNGDGVVTLEELIRSTLHIAGLIFALLVSVIGSVWIGIVAPWGWVKLLVCIVGISIFAAAVLGLWRQSRYERAERLAAQDRAFERERQRYEFDLLRGAAQREDDTRWTQATQDQYARLWLALSYERGKPITRDEWRDLGQPVDAWNRINGLMNKYGIRNRRDLQHDTLSEAWGVWCDAEMESRQWIKSGIDYIKN